MHMFMPKYKYHLNLSGISESFQDYPWIQDFEADFL